MIKKEGKRKMIGVRNFIECPISIAINQLIGTPTFLEHNLLCIIYYTIIILLIVISKCFIEYKILTKSMEN